MSDWALNGVWIERIERAYFPLIPNIAHREAGSGEWRVTWMTWAGPLLGVISFLFFSAKFNKIWRITDSSRQKDNRHILLKYCIEFLIQCSDVKMKNQENCNLKCENMSFDRSCMILCISSWSWSEKQELNCLVGCQRGFYQVMRREGCRWERCQHCIMDSSCSGQTLHAILLQRNYTSSSV